MTVMRGNDRVVGCVLPKGMGLALLERLYREKGVTRADVHNARGFLGSDPRGLFNRVEKEFLTVVVEPDRADEIFAWIYHEAGVSEVEGRFLYMTAVSHATPFSLPADVPMEER